jgi:hypothetical protein
MEKEIVQQEVVGPKNIFMRYFTVMPIFFPLIGLFLLGLSLFECWNYLADDSVFALYRFRPVVMLLYFVFWAAACMGRKWGALAFIVLTILNVAFYLFGPDILLKRAFGDLLFVPIPVNLVFSFLLLFYFRKFK